MGGIITQKPRRSDDRWGFLYSTNVREKQGSFRDFPVFLMGYGDVFRETRAEAGVPARVGRWTTKKIIKLMEMFISRACGKMEPDGEHGMYYGSFPARVGKC